MMLRRNILLAGLGLGALGVSEALRPRQRLILLKGSTIAAALPTEFGPWASEDATLVNPGLAGRLSRTLYSETVSRIYYNNETRAGVMLLIAYGDTQSDLLQLHRPETCYPAVGYALQRSRLVDIPVGRGVSVPGRSVVAVAEDRIESILYWTRLGERLPQSGGQQRMARLENSMEGYVADGALVRCSALGDVGAAYKILNDFVPTMLAAVNRKQLPAFVGTKLARRIA